MTDELQSEFDILFSSRLQPLALIRWSIKFWRKAIGIVSPSVLKAGEGAELVVGTGSMDMLGGMLAERLGVPCVYAWWLPMLAARDFLFNTTENPLPRLPGWLNRGGVQTYRIRVVARDARRAFPRPRRFWRRARGTYPTAPGRGGARRDLAARL